MSVIEIGTKLVQLSNEGKGLEAVDTLYGENVVSIEGQGSDAIPARLEGLQNVRGKSVWWYDNHEVHAATATGPFVGHREDQFVVQFDLDTTPKSTGERGQMREVGLYTVEGGKIVQEEFLYLMA